MHIPSIKSVMGHGWWRNWSGTNKMQQPNFSHDGICIYMGVCIFKDLCYTTILENNHINLIFYYMQWILRHGQVEVQTSKVYGIDIIYG
jgi:hypothetical protein